MTFGYYNNNLNINPYVRSNLNFRAQSSPVQNIESSIEKLTEKIDEEKKKKHHKTAITVGGSVLGVSLLVTVLNPRISSKLINKAKFEKVKGAFLGSKFYKFLTWLYNFNSVKDTFFKQLCTEEKSFFNIKNLNRRKRFQKIDKVFLKILKKPHELISGWGESLAKHTVRNSYKKAAKKMDNFENLIQKLSENLPEDKKNQIAAKLRQIQAERGFFSMENLDLRFAEKAKLMENLNTDIRNHWKKYRHGFVDKKINTADHFSKNLSFWAQDMMEPVRNSQEKIGQAAIDKLMGNRNGMQGQYRELIDIMSDSISSEEKAMLEKSLLKTEKSLRKAGKREYCDYFDKRRDLELGSAPTDIVTGIVGLSIGGIALATADDKDDRISRLLTKIGPTVAGFGTNIALTAMLFSGLKGLALGVGTGWLLSLVGSKLDKHRLALKASLTGNDDKDANRMERTDV